MSACYEYEGTRYVRGRHFTECGGEDCSGCLRCPERHCGECSRGMHLRFGENTCPECIARVRASLQAILELAAALPEEAEIRGVNSEAANLAGPAADPEAWSWRKAHLAKTIPWAQLPDDDEHHPAAHVIDREGNVWRIVRDGGMATRAVFQGAISVGIAVLERDYGPLTPLAARAAAPDGLREAVEGLAAEWERPLAGARQRANIGEDFAAVSAEESLRRRHASQLRDILAAHPAPGGGA